MLAPARIPAFDFEQKQVSLLGAIMLLEIEQEMFKGLIDAFSSFH